MARADGATMGYFPPDEATFLYLKATGRADAHIDAVRNYFQAQGMFGIPRGGDCDYSTLLELDLGTVVPSVAGPKRPQDRIGLPNLKISFSTSCRNLFPMAAMGRRAQTSRFDTQRTSARAS